MPAAPVSRPVLKTIRESLEALAQRRRQETSGRRWDDFELEPAEYNNAYKYVDGIEPFLLAYRHFPEEFSRLPLDEEIVVDDVKYVLDSVVQHNFVPGAYSYENVSEYTDYAADVLRLALDFRHWATQSRIEHPLADILETVMAKAIAFLVDSARTEASGVYWSGNANPSSPGHIYYTAKAVTSLAHALREGRVVTDAIRPRAVAAVQGSSLWFMRRVRGETYFSDDNNEIADSIACLYPLYALGSSWDLQNRTDELKSYVTRCVRRYQDYLTDNYDEFNKEIFFRVFVDRVPFNIEDRSSGGTCLSAFALIWGAADDAGIRTPELYRFVQELSSRVRQERDEVGRLWYREPAVWATCSSIEGLLLQERFARAMGVAQFDEIQLTELVRRVFDKKREQLVRLFVEEFRSDGKTDAGGGIE
jgi:hypothetical protein